MSSHVYVHIQEQHTSNMPSDADIMSELVSAGFPSAVTTAASSRPFNCSQMTPGIWHMWQIWSCIWDEAEASGNVSWWARLSSSPSPSPYSLSTSLSPLTPVGPVCLCLHTQTHTHTHTHTHTGLTLVDACAITWTHAPPNLKRVDSCRLWWRRAYGLSD